jgi:hypothetical protein
MKRRSFLSSIPFLSLPAFGGRARYPALQKFMENLPEMFRHLDSLDETIDCKRKKAVFFGCDGHLSKNPFPKCVLVFETSGKTEVGSEKVVFNSLFGTDGFGLSQDLAQLLEDIKRDGFSAVPFGLDICNVSDIRLRLYLDVKKSSTGLDGQIRSV